MSKPLYIIRSTFVISLIVLLIYDNLSFCNKSVGLDSEHGKNSRGLLMKIDYESYPRNKEQYRCYLMAELIAISSSKKSD